MTSAPQTSNAAPAGIATASRRAGVSPAPKTGTWVRPAAEATSARAGAARSTTANANAQSMVTAPPATTATSAPLALERTAANRSRKIARSAARIKSADLGLCVSWVLVKAFSGVQRTRVAERENPAAAGANARAISAGTGRGPAASPNHRSLGNGLDEMGGAGIPLVLACRRREVSRMRLSPAAPYLAPIPRSSCAGQLLGDGREESRPFPAICPSTAVRLTTSSKPFASRAPRRASGKRRWPSEGCPSGANALLTNQPPFVSSARRYACSPHPFEP